MSARKPLPPPSGAEALKATLAGRLNHSAEEPPPVAQEPAQPRTAASPPKPPPATERPVMDEMEKRRRRREIGATGLALRAAHEDVAAKEADWVRLIEKARADGVPERLLIAAAADADLDLPDRL